MFQDKLGPIVEFKIKKGVGIAIKSKKTSS